MRWCINTYCREFKSVQKFLWIRLPAWSVKYSQRLARVALCEGRLFVVHELIFARKLQEEAISEGERRQQATWKMSLYSTECYYAECRRLRACR